MLVLTRKKDETILIKTPEGVVIRITLLACRSAEARIAVAAPASFMIAREEIARNF